MRIASLWSLDLEVVVELFHLWLSLVTLIVYYIYGQILLHLWLVDLLHLWLKLLHLWLALHLWTIFITFMVGITFMVFITFMSDTRANVFTFFLDIFFF